MNTHSRAVGLATFLLLAGCSGGDLSQPAGFAEDPSRPAGSPLAAPSARIDPSPTADPVEPGPACDLLTGTDILELTQLEVISIEPRPVGGIFESGCFWTLVEESSGLVQAEVLLGVATPGGRAHYETFIAPDAAALGLEPLDGIGDAALSGSGGTALMVVVDDTLVDLQWLSPTTDPTNVPVALIRRVLANLADA